MSKHTLTLLFLLFLSAIALAEPPADRPPDREFTLVAKAADASDAAPPHALYLRATDELSGNAATVWLTALNLTEGPRFDGQDTVSDAHERLFEAFYNPVAMLSPDEARVLVDMWALSLETAHVAARRPDVRWDFPIRQQEAYRTLLPHLNQARVLAQVLGVKARMQALGGEWDEFMATIRVGRQLALHVGRHQEAVLVERLIGIGLERDALRSISDGLDVGPMPNLYHALSAVRPTFDTVKSVEVERANIYAAFPRLLAADGLTEDDVETLASLFNTSCGPDNLPEPATSARIVSDARVYLASLPGADQEDVASLAGPSAVTRSMRHEIEVVSDANLRLTATPLTEAVLTATDEDSNTPAFGYARLVAPDMPPVLRRVGVLERQWAMLVTVEALRDYAAEHGSLPDELDAVRLHLPDDPFTGGPLGYDRDGDASLLIAPPFDPSDPATGVVWRLTLRQD